MKIRQKVIFVSIFLNLVFFANLSLADYCVCRKKNHSGFTSDSISFGSYYSNSTDEVCKTVVFENYGCQFYGDCPSYMTCECQSSSDQVTRVINGISSAPPTNRFTLEGTFPTALSVNSSTSYTICFDPTVTGSDSGTFSLNSSPSANDSSITVSATKIEVPNITISAIDFGTETSIKTLTKTFTIRNRHPDDDVSINNIYGIDLENCEVVSVTQVIAITADGYETVTLKIRALDVGNYSGTIVVDSSCDDPTIDFSGYTSGVIGASRYDFGDVYLRQSDTIDFPITNNSSDEITITNVTHSLSVFSSSDWEDIVVPGKSSVNIPTTFTPTNTVYYTEWMTIETTDETKNIRIYGTGAEEISVSTEKIYVYASVGETETLIINISNTSSKIFDLSIDGSGDDEFELQTILTSIEPYSDEEIYLEFTPTVDGEYNYTLSITAESGSTTISDTIVVNGTTFSEAVPAGNAMTIIIISLILVGIGSYSFRRIKSADKI